MQTQIPAGAKAGELIVEVTRRDDEGNVIREDNLGVVSATYRNPFKHLAMQLWMTVRDWHRVRTGKLQPPRQP